MASVKEHLQAIEELVQASEKANLDFQHALCDAFSDAMVMEGVGVEQQLRIIQRVDASVTEFLQKVRDETTPGL